MEKVYIEDPNSFLYPFEHMEYGFDHPKDEQGNSIDGFSARYAFKCICSYGLGEDWYTPNPVSEAQCIGEQCEAVLRKCSPKWRYEVRYIRKHQRLWDDLTIAGKKEMSYWGALTSRLDAEQHNKDNLFGPAYTAEQVFNVLVHYLASPKLRLPYAMSYTAMYRKEYGWYHPEDSTFDLVSASKDPKAFIPSGIYIPRIILVDDILTRNLNRDYLAYKYFFRRSHHRQLLKELKLFCDLELKKEIK